MSSSSRRAPSSPAGVGEIWQTRTDLVKQERAAASAAADAKTARLRALRLEKEVQDAQAARLAAAEAAPAPVKMRAKGGV